MSRISLKYILNALFSKCEDDFEKKLDKNVAYNAPVVSDAKISETLDELDSDIKSIKLEEIDTTYLEKEDDIICEIENNNLPCETVGQDKINNQVEFLNNEYQPISNGESLLYNHKCMKMIECCLDNLSLIDELDETTPISAVKDIIRQNYIETLITIGASPIVDEYKFNAARHKPAPAGFIKPNSPIEIITPGIEIDGKTLIKAIVKPLNNKK